jgi:hypothetical protein
LVLYIEKIRPSDFRFYRDIFTKEQVIQPTAPIELRPQVDALSEEEKEWGRIAWTFFERNYQPATGMVNSVHGYPSTTLWDLASYLHGMFSAFEIEIITEDTLSARYSQLIRSMKAMPLFEHKLPNKVYHTGNLVMSNYGNMPVIKGVGWSAMDIGRFLSVGQRIQNRFPKYWPAFLSLIEQWDLAHVLDQGVLRGVMFSTKDQSTRLVQEGKLGYEEYAAKGFLMMGLDALDALSYTDFLKFVEIGGEHIAVDTREVTYFPAYNYILSEPYFLDGLEYGWDMQSKELAKRVFRVQKRRWEEKGIITAMSEDHIDQEPYFLYNSIYANGESWTCISESGIVAQDLRTFSTKTAFAWYALYADSYTDVLVHEAKSLFHPDLGWYAGKYEKTGKINTALTANTNGIILTCLSYRRFGPVNQMKRVLTP